MTMKQFILFAGTFSPYGRNHTKIASIWKDVFNLKETDFIDVDVINNLNLDQMKRFCRAIEAPHGVVTNGSEPVFVRPGERHKWEAKTDYEEDDSDRFEDEENEIRMVTNHDNMLEHLSDEEREAYLRDRRAAKEKFGQNYDGDRLDFSKLSEKQRILFQLSWRLEDIPEEHHSSILMGRIPADFREEFISALPDPILEKYNEKYFEKNRIPKVMVKALTAARKDSYMHKMKEELQKPDNDDDDEDNEDDDDDDNDDDKKAGKNDGDKKVKHQEL